MEIINTIVHIFHSLLKEIVKVSQLPEYFTTINESIRRGIVEHYLSDSGSLVKNYSCWVFLN